MNRSEINVIESLCDNKIIRKDLLRDKIGLKNWQFNKVTRKLKQLGFIEKDSLYVGLADNVNARLIMNLSKKYDLHKLLQFSNEIVLKELSNGVTIKELIKKTNTSKATVYRALADFEDLGIIKRTIMLNDDDELKLFNSALRFGMKVNQ